MLNFLSIESRVSRALNSINYMVVKLDELKDEALLRGQELEKKILDTKQALYNNDTEISRIERISEKLRGLVS